MLNGWKEQLSLLKVDAPFGGLGEQFARQDEMCVKM